jgi:hypothetical protein
MAYAVGFFSSLAYEQQPTTQTKGTFYWLHTKGNTAAANQEFF